MALKSNEQMRDYHNLVAVHILVISGDGDVIFTSLLLTVQVKGPI